MALPDMSPLAAALFLIETEKMNRAYKDAHELRNMNSCASFLHFGGNLL